jgi:hypothetical protein
MWRPSHLEYSYHHSRPAAFRPRFTTGLAFTLSVLPVFHLLPYSQAVLRPRYHRSFLFFPIDLFTAKY